MRRLGFLVIILGALSSTTSAIGATWRVDRDCSTVEFSVRQMLVTHVRGTFSRVHGLVHIDDEDVRRSQVSVRIAAESLRTDRDGLAAFLRGPRLFHASEFSELTFQSNKVMKRPDGGLTVVGELTIRGVTREVTLEVPKAERTINGGPRSKRLGVYAVAKINRKQFGMTWSPALDHGGMVVGDEVDIRIHLQLIQKDAHTERQGGTLDCLPTETTGG